MEKLPQWSLQLYAAYMSPYTGSDDFVASFAGLGFLTFYLAGKLHLFDNRGHVVSSFVRCGKMHVFDHSDSGQSVDLSRSAVGRCVCSDFTHYGLSSYEPVLPQTCSTLIFCCLDHWEDVVTGSALGLLLAYFSYRQYYPHLSLEDAHVPYATRFEETEIGEAEVMDPLIRYEEGNEEISTRRNPKTGIRR